MSKKTAKIDLVHWAICLIFVSTPIESISVFGKSSSFSIVRLSFLLLFLVWLLLSHKLEINKMIVSYLLLAGYFVIGLLWSINIESSLTKIGTFLLPTILLCSIISINTQSERDFEMYVVSYLIGCVVLSVFAYANREQILLDATYADMERVSALGQDPNEFCVLLNTGIGMLLHYLGSKKKLSIVLIVWAVIAFWSFVVLSTGSRTGSIILISLFVAYLFNNKASIPFMLPLLLVAAFYLSQYISSGILERLMETSDSIKSNDMSERGLIWHWAWISFQEENAALGVGFGNFPEMLISHGYPGRASHNTYLSYLICGGIVGAAFFLGIIVRIIDYVIKIHRIEKKWNMLYYILPLFIGMITLETNNRRWLFLLGLMVYKYYKLISVENDRIVVNTSIR
jgi:hypothetical protein